MMLSFVESIVVVASIFLLGLIGGLILDLLEYAAEKREEKKSSKSREKR